MHIYIQTILCQQFNMSTLHTLWLTYLKKAYKQNFSVWISLGAKPQSRVESGGLVKLKLQQSCTGLERPLSFREDEAPRYHDNRHMKLVMLSASRTGRIYSPGNISGTHFC